MAGPIEEGRTMTSNYSLLCLTIKIVERGGRAIVQSVGHLSWKWPKQQDPDNLYGPLKYQ